MLLKAPFRYLRSIMALFVSLPLALVAAAPLMPGLTPGWPRASHLTPLVFSIVALLATFTVVAIRGSKAVTYRLSLVSALFAVYALYVGNGMNLTSGDNMATRALPSRIVRDHTLDLSGVPEFDKAEPPYWVTRSENRLLNAFPNGTALVAVPYAVLGLAGSGGLVTPELISRWEKHSAALLSIIAAALIFAGLRTFGWTAAFGATFVFALATPVPSTTAQALWSFTGEILCIALAMALLLRQEPSSMLAGSAMGLAFACRPTALVTSAAIGLVVLTGTGAKAARRYALGLAVVCATVGCVHLSLYGHVLGTYGRTDLAPEALNRFPIQGMIGVLTSPSRGLLVFFPYVLLLPLSYQRLRECADRQLSQWWWASVGVLAFAIVAADLHATWWGGWSLGPRLMTEAAPFLAICTVPLWNRAGWLRTALLLTVSFSAATQLLLCYNPAAGEWNPKVLGSQGVASLFSLSGSQLRAAWDPNWTPRHGGGSLSALVGPEDPTLMGSVDEPAPDQSVHGILIVRGWARVPGEDLSVMVFLDGNQCDPRRLVRQPRPDVEAAIPGIGDCGQAGYEMRLPSTGRAGLHEIRVVFQSSNGRIRHYQERRILWR